MTREQILFNIIKQCAKDISFTDFRKIINNVPFFYSKKLANSNTYASVFGNTYYYNLEEFIPLWIDTDTKSEAYKRIDKYINQFLSFIKKDLTNEKINKYIHECIEADCECFDSKTYSDAINLIKKINVIDANKYIYDLIQNEISIQQHKFYVIKIKNWINKEFENRIKQENTNTPQISSLKELKNLNNKGTIFIIDNSVIDEIDNATNKFIWIEGQYIDSSMEFGTNHAIMQKNYLRKRRGEQIDEFDKDYISNTREPEDLIFDITEEEANLHVAYGSFYFNNQVCIIEGKYKITESDYNQLLKELTKRFTHVFDFTLQGRQLKQEAKYKTL